MDEYKPITGELRGACRESNVYHVMSDTVDRTVTFDGDRFDGLCDDIDSVHARLESDYARLKAERDSMAAALDAAQGEHAYAPESHYMMLPKDADGVPIHVGDVLEFDIESGPVQHLELWSDGSWVVVVEREPGHFTRWHPSAVCHHHAPTVGDVLMKMLEQAVGYSDAHTTVALDAISEYAAKLRLAGEK